MASTQTPAPGRGRGALQVWGVLWPPRLSPGSSWGYCGRQVRRGERSGRGYQSSNNVNQDCRENYSWLPRGWMRGARWMRSPDFTQSNGQPCLPYRVPYGTCGSPVLRQGRDGILTLGITALGEAYFGLRTQNLHLPLSPSEAEDEEYQLKCGLNLLKCMHSFGIWDSIN